MPKFLARADLSQIEARVTPWLAGAEWKLDAFRAYDTILRHEWNPKKKKMVAVRGGPDLYKVCAAGINQIAVEDVTDQQRQGQGKVPELALGFGGGCGALQNMAKVYRVNIPVSPVDEKGMATPAPLPGTDQWIVNKWRGNNPEIVGFWKGLEAAAMECMRKPYGQAVEVWTQKKSFDGERVVWIPWKRTLLCFVRNKRALCLRLPDGGGLFYWNPDVRRTPTKFGERWTLWYSSEDSVTHQWKSYPYWGGLGCENVVQRVARDVMRDGLLLMRKRGYAAVLTVHDEAIAEIEAATADEAAALVLDCVTQNVPWAPGLPVAADASADRRYFKSE